jgi:hypothetical protein
MRDSVRVFDRLQSQCGIHEGRREGFESRVLKGATELLAAEDPPILQLEINSEALENPGPLQLADDTPVQRLQISSRFSVNTDTKSSKSM